ncbi:MAG: YncE family protein [Candidatus Acidiferrum sp.]
MAWRVAASILVSVAGLLAGTGAAAQEKMKLPPPGVDMPLAIPTPKPALVVLNKDENELAIVDPATLKVVGKVITGPVPHEVAVSADGKIAVVTNYGAHADGTTLSVIDLKGQKEIHRVNLGELRGPHGVVFFDSKAWFTAEGSKKVARYDPATNKIDWTHEIAENRTHMLVISRDGHTIYASNVNSDSVTVVEEVGNGGKVTNTVIAVGKGPEAIDLSPNGKELWVGNSGDGTVSLIDTKAKKVVATIEVKTKHSNRLKFTLDGKLVLISDMGSGDVVVVDAGARKEVKRLHLGSSVEGILMQPDGTRAFVAVSADDKVAVLDLKTLEVVGTVATGKDPDGLAWASEGSY